mmetsp:Transcript_13091/g.33201  ORF Transcript_13091/g.33201 Transcript_13091/m.33201 type:complete len:218 (-) Transcript_13091:3148-3801(-)
MAPSPAFVSPFLPSKGPIQSGVASAKGPIQSGVTSGKERCTSSRRSSSHPTARARPPAIPHPVGDQLLHRPVLLLRQPLVNGPPFLLLHLAVLVSISDSSSGRSGSGGNDDDLVTHGLLLDFLPKDPPATALEVAMMLWDRARGRGAPGDLRVRTVKGKWVKEMQSLGRTREVGMNLRQAPEIDEFNAAFGKDDLMLGTNDCRTFATQLVRFLTTDD